MIGLVHVRNEKLLYNVASVHVSAGQKLVSAGQELSFPISTCYVIFTRCALAAEELGVLVGAEFRAAAEAAASVHAAVCLGDRPINVSRAGVVEMYRP